MSNAYKSKFFDFGIQYYVAARFAGSSNLNPICANLCHHAVEMFLKGCHFRDSMDDEQIEGKLNLLKGNFGHGLKSLWVAFKQTSRKPAGELDKYDKVIDELDKFESIRYPDKILKEGMISSINFGELPPLEIPGGSVPEYLLGMVEIDELVKIIFEKASVNPKVFPSIKNSHCKQYLGLENEVIDFWGVGQ
ncbi:MAG: hypothetical protein O7F12_05925 [Nitrospirae bacterium]|nr:hypothetical protein [Nitrospirota bacterium]